MASDKWLESGEEPGDLYDLAGLARFHPVAKDILAALDRLTSELNLQRAHWRNEVRGKAERMLALAQQGRQIFSQDAARAAYDERLFAQTAGAFQSAFPASMRQHEQVRRWLRLTQNVHASKVEEVLRRLATAEEKSAIGPQPTERPQPTATAPSPTAVIATPTPPTPEPAENPVRVPKRPPPRPSEQTRAPDDFGLLWIVGTAVVTSIVFVLLLFFFFGSRFTAKRDQAQANGQKASAPEQASAPGSGGEDQVGAADNKTNTPPSDPGPESSPKTTSPAPDSSKSEPQKKAPQKSPKGSDTNPVPDPNAPPPPTTTTPPKTPITPPTTTPPTTATTPPEPSSTTPLPPAGNVTRQIVRQGLSVHTVAWNATGDRLAVGGDGDTVRIWDVTKNTEAQVLKEPFPSCAALAFGKGKLAAATGQGTVYVWNTSTWKLEASLRHADMQDAKSVAWGNSSDPQIIVGDSEGNLRFLSLTGGNQTAVIELAKAAGGIQSLVATSKSKPLWITGHLDGSVLIWSAAGKNVMSCLASSSASVLDELVQPNAGASKSAQLTPHGKEVCYDLAVSPDEKLLAVAAQDVDLWELDTKNYLVRRRFVNGAKNDTGYRAAAFSNDGKLLAVGAGDGTLMVIDIAAWSALYLEKFAGLVHRLAWRPGTTRQLAVGCEDGTAVIITLAKEATIGSVPSPLDPKTIITEAQQNAADQDWGTLAQRISYLSIYRLPSTEKTTLDRLRLEARKGAKELINSVSSKSIPQDELEGAASTLQQAIDLDPSGEGGRAARAALSQLDALTVAKMKAPAANKSGGPNQPAGNPAGGRFGTTGRRAGAAALGIPAGTKKRP